MPFEKGHQFSRGRPKGASGYTPVVKEIGKKVLEHLLTEGRQLPLLFLFDQMENSANEDVL